MKILILGFLAFFGAASGYANDFQPISCALKRSYNPQYPIGLDMSITQNQSKFVVNLGHIEISSENDSTVVRRPRHGNDYWFDIETPWGHSFFFTAQPKNTPFYGTLFSIHDGETIEALFLCEIISQEV